ncbi:hypothetical protein HYV69_04010 [Candidatus Uhrbacteria bacterium]|nr:hypothetical protein [Candidatus Uhrbacteria bacterium]
MFDIITIGSATRDVFLVSKNFIALKSKKFPTGSGECVALGSKVDLDKLILTTGGGATNTASTFSLLDFHTATMTRIGDDSSGKDVIDDLNRFGVSTHYVRMIKNWQTGFSVLLTMPDGERTALVYRGVSAKFEVKDVHWEGCKQTKWIYLTSLGGNLALSKKIIQHANKCGIKVAWNPGVGEIKNGMKEIKPILTMVDVLNINTEEARLLTGKKTIKTMFSVLQTKDTIRIITDGTKGSYTLENGKILHAFTTGARAISRTGAGDAFGSGFVAGLIKKNNVKYALAVGTLNAESVIQNYGAKNGILKKWPSILAIGKIKIEKL